MAEASRTDWSSLKEIRIEFDNPLQADAVSVWSRARRPAPVPP